jgi:hypothetical protein
MQCTKIVARTLSHCCNESKTLHCVCHRQLFKYIEKCTTVLLWQIYVAGSNKTYLRLHVKCPMLHWNKRMFICSWPTLDYSWNKQIVIADKSFAVSRFRAAVIHFARSDGINQLRSNKNKILRVFVFLPKLVGMKLKFFRSPMACPTLPLFFHIIS